MFPCFSNLLKGSSESIIPYIVPKFTSVRLGSRGVGIVDIHKNDPNYLSNIRIDGTLTTLSLITRRLEALVEHDLRDTK